MSARSILGITAAILGLIGLTAGFFDWLSHNYLLPSVDWEGPLVTLSEIIWLTWVVAASSAIIALGIATALPIKAVAVPAPASSPVPEPAKPEPAREKRVPPPIPAAQPENPPSQAAPAHKESAPAAEAKEDLWQSADAPFPAPASIEHPSAGPSLWQSDQSSPFPKLDVPEEDAKPADTDQPTESAPEKKPDQA
ncbi:MAG: hypothetical protein AAFX93_09735 [Verrucomicrobiota bacterium]